MVGNYVLDIVSWIFFFLAIGTINLPLTRLLLPLLPDRGWIFSKISALLFVSYAAWVLGILKILPFSNGTLWLLILFLLILNMVVQRRTKKPWLKNLPTKIIFLEELIFLTGFIFWLLVRAHNPDIHDLEKFMDFGFINSILKSSFFPPKDIWLSGGTINYYYFGHLGAAVVIKTLGSLPEVGYNLILSLLFALTLAGSFSIGFNLSQNFAGRRSRICIISGLLTAVFLTLFGNLQVVFALLKGLGSYWYPDATRFIPNTIHEFPIYSFVVADLHGHLFDVPTVLLMLIFLYSNFPLEKITNDPSEKNKRSTEPAKEAEPANFFPKLIFPGFLLSLMYMTNAADALIYAGLLFLTLLYIEFFAAPRRRIEAKKLLSFARTLASNAVTAFVFSLPFQLTFKPFAEGIKLSPERSPLWMFLILWGTPLFFSLIFFVNYLNKKTEKSTSDAFIFIITVLAVTLIILPEIIYFKDIYTSQPRANTMFKLTYQAFILFAIGVSYTLSKLSLATLAKPSFKGIFALLVGLNLIEILSLYPYLAVTSAYGKNLFTNLRGLDGMKYLESTRPGDYSAIKWINENISGQPIILEAVGESYTDYGRISANTGLPTVLGWPVHEWLWRKDVTITDLRRKDVESIYNGINAQLVKKLLRDYRVEYIYIGQLEREKYPVLDENLLTSLGETVYASLNSRLIRVK